MPRFLFACLLGIALFAVACDTTTPQPEQQVVVEGYLQANAPLETIRLTRTVETEEPYRPSEAAVRGAEVVVQRLEGDGTVAEAVSFTERDSKPGVYEPETAAIVQPATQYRLRATTPDGEELTATTTLPEDIEVVESRNDTAVYQSDDQPALTIPAGPQGDSQNVFVFTTRSLLDFDRPEQELRAQLTPFYRSNYEPEEDSIDAFQITSSGLLNEGNYDRSEGTITIRLPWFAVAFFGPNEIAVNVVDDNLYDFLRTQQAQQSGLAAQQPGLGPGEIPNVIEHVEGGTGVFGSYVQASRQITIECPEERSDLQCPDGTQ